MSKKAKKAARKAKKAAREEAESKDTENIDEVSKAPEKILVEVGAPTKDAKKARPKKILALAVAAVFMAAGAVLVWGLYFCVFQRIAIRDTTGRVHRHYRLGNRNGDRERD